MTLREIFELELSEVAIWEIQNYRNITVSYRFMTTIDNIRGDEVKCKYEYKDSSITIL